MSREPWSRLDDRLLQWVADLARDARAAAEGRRTPAQLYRDLRPWSSYALIALLVVGAAVPVANAFQDAGRPRAVGTPLSTEPVGPRAGEVVDTYLAAARAELLERATAEPDAVAYAVVHFTTYLQPDAVAGAIPGVRPVRALTRLPLAGQQTEIHDFPVVVLPESLTLGYREVARTKVLEAVRIERLQSSNPAAVDPQTAQAGVLARKESQAYADDCACVFAMVVQGEVSALASLPGKEFIRGVDLAPPRTSPVATAFFGLLPDQTDVVTPPGATPTPTPLA